MCGLQFASPCPRLQSSASVTLVCHVLLLYLTILNSKQGQSEDAEFSSIQLLNHVQHFVTPWTVAHQASLSITNSWGLLRLMSIELVMPPNHLILCRPLLLLPSVFHSIRVFFHKSAGSSAFSKPSLNMWKFADDVRLKPGLENFEHYFASV